MNRSVERTRLSASGVAPGEIVVATGFVHPQRGWVRCPAAPLLAAEASKVDRIVRTADVSTGFATEDATLHAVSWIDAYGDVNGFAIAAPAGDQGAQVVASRVLQAWTRVVRTRRVLVAVTEESPLRAMWTTALTRTHEYVARGDTVALIARRGDAVGHSSGSTVVLEAVGDVDALTGIDPDHLSFVVVPGIPLEEASVIMTALRTRFPRLRGMHPDEFCYSASDRRESLRSVAMASDVTLLCEPDDEQVAWMSALPTHQLAHVGQICPNWVVSAATVALAAGSSAQEGLLDEVIGVLRGLGPLSVVRRQVSTRVVDLSATAFTVEAVAEDGVGHSPLVPAQRCATADAADPAFTEHEQAR